MPFLNIPVQCGMSSVTQDASAATPSSLAPCAVLSACGTARRSVLSALASSFLQGRRLALSSHLLLRRHPVKSHTQLTREKLSWRGYTAAATSRPQHATGRSAGTAPGLHGFTGRAGLGWRGGRNTDLTIEKWSSSLQSAARISVY